MKTSYQGRAFLCREEGVVMTAYRDSEGVWTIGVGHTTMAGPPAVTSHLSLSLAECFALFERDLIKYEAGVNAALKVPVPQHVFDAAVSFHYNTGAIGKASWVDSINRGDMNDAAKRFMLYNKPPEIIGRRKRELHLLLTGDYGNIATVPVWERKGGKAKAMPLPKPVTPIPPTPPEPPQPRPDDPGPQPREPVEPTPMGTPRAAGIGAALVVGGAAIAGFWHQIGAFFSHLFGG